jgi:hypothetical protein
VWCLIVVASHGESWLLSLIIVRFLAHQQQQKAEKLVFGALVLEHKISWRARISERCARARSLLLTDSEQ